MSKVIEKVDVIAQFKHNGDIIPLRFQIKNEDGELEAYNVNGYRRVAIKGAFTTSDSIFVCNNTIMLECQVFIYNQAKVVRLYFQPEGHIWLLGID
jgi:hypothetical protein